jgi:hypothetical protein
MRNFINIRLWGFAAFLGTCAGASGQAIVVHTNPTLIAYDAKETFSEFAPAGGTAVTQTGLSVFGGLGMLQLTNPSTSLYAIYNDLAPSNPASLDWSLGALGNSGVFGGPQGLGIENLTSNGAPAGVSAALTLGATETYFGGFFQSALIPGNGASGVVDFTFYDSTNNVVGTEQSLITGNSTSGSLIGVGFEFTGGWNYSSVMISGVGVTMDSLRIGKTFTVVPEPASFAPLGLGVLFFIRRKRR